MEQFADFEPDIAACDLKRFAESTDHELIDNDGEQFSEVVKTAETLDNFEESSQRWRERSGAKRGTVGGFPFVAWASVQVRRGDTRCPRSVVDFGDWRLAVDADLELWEEC